MSFGSGSQITNRNIFGRKFRGEVERTMRERRVGFWQAAKILLTRRLDMEPDEPLRMRRKV